MVLVIYRPKSQ